MDPQILNVSWGIQLVFGFILSGILRIMSIGVVRSCGNLNEGATIVAAT